jgi:hypothetical protein
VREYELASRTKHGRCKDDGLAWPGLALPFAFFSSKANDASLFRVRGSPGSNRGGNLKAPGIIGIRTVRGLLQFAVILRARVTVKLEAYAPSLRGSSWSHLRPSHP